MQRFSISVDDELAAWIETQADDRGVSKAKVIRDAIETARITGLVHPSTSDVIEGEDLLDRIERLEARVAAFEEGTDSAEPATTQEAEKLIQAFEAQLADRPPKTEHGKQAVVRVFSMLLENGPMQTSELREALYPDFEDEFASPESMWQSINRYFSDLEGIKKVGHGKWDADLTSIDETPS